MTPKKISPLALARILIILQLVTLCVSTAAASVSEVLIYLAFICSGQLRRRVLAVLRQPMVVMTLVIWAMVGIGTLYSAAPFADAADVWGSWRKCLLLPLAVAAFDDPKWKERFLWVFIGLMAVAATLSFLEALLHFRIHPKLEENIVIANHSTQSIYFAAASFASLVMLLFTKYRFNRLLWLMTAIITANLILVTWGRSGYLAFMVFMALLALWKTQGWTRVGLLSITPLLVVLALLLSPVARQGIEKGFKEIQNYETAPKITSMGTRVVFWKNTMAILKKMEHPLIGYGTDGFKVPYAAQVEGQEGWQGVNSTDPHNQYLKILVEYGLIGLILFLLFIASFFRQPVPVPFYYLGIGVLIAWCTTSLFNGHFGTFNEGRLLFLWCGVMLGQEGTSKEPAAP